MKYVKVFEDFTSSKSNEASSGAPEPLKLKDIKINNKNHLTYNLEIGYFIGDELVMSYLTTGSQKEAQELKNKVEKAFKDGKIISPSGIGYYAFNEAELNEGVVSIKGGRILAHKVLNKLVDMEVIPVKKKTEDLVEAIASLLASASMNEAYDFIKKTPFSTLANLAELSQKFNLRKFWQKKDTFRGFDMKMLLPALNSSLMKNKIGLQFNPEHDVMLSADLNPYIGLHIVQKSVGVTLEIGKPTNPAYKKSDAIGGDTYEEIADIIAKILKDNSGVVADLQKIEKHPFQQNEAIDVKYWTDYNTDTSGQSDPEFAIKSKDFEATFKEAVKDWNDRGEDPISMGEAEKVKKIAKEFFNKAGWISVNITHAMIAQES